MKGRQAGARSRALSALWLVGVSLGIPEVTCAQVRPDAGRTLESVRPQPQSAPPNPAAALPTQDERPALTAGDAERISVSDWRITGAHVFPTAELSDLIKEYKGWQLTLAQLNAAAARITAHYRQHGYLLSRAYLPAQEIRGGIVEIAVLEGRLAEVKVANTSRVSQSVVERRTESLQTPGAINGSKLERSLLLMSDLPGVEVRSTLRPGAAVGTSNLDLQVRGTKRIEGSIDGDSFGNRYTGEFRGGGTINMNNPFGRGDQFTLRALTAGSGMSYGRASWQTPIGSDGLNAGIAWSYLDYSLGEDFEALDAQGTAQVGTLWFSYPLVRRQMRNLRVQLSYDDKRLEDEVKTTASDNRKDLEVLTLGLAGDWTDGVGGGGFSTYGVSVTYGRLSLDPLVAAMDNDIGGHDTDGEYAKLSYNFSRLQRLSERFTLYAALAGQLSNKNLDSSEKQSLGGAYAVRAYPEGEGAGDAAAVLNVELRYSLPRLPEMQALVFVDAGTVQMYHSRIATDTDNRRSLTGEGVGAQWLRPGRFGAKAYLAWRSGPEPDSDSDRRPRFWVQFAKYF